MADDAAQELELDYANKKVKLRGREVIQTILGIVLVAFLSAFGYGLYDHMKESAKRDDKFVAAIDAMTASSNRNGVTQREMVCVLLLPQDARTPQLGDPASLCKRLANLP